MADEVIRWLKRRVAELDELGFTGAPNPQPNDRVGVVDGPLQGMKATLDRRLSA